MDEHFLDLLNGFRINGAFPIDSRFVIADEAARLAIPSGALYQGLMTYQESDGRLFILDDVGNITWREISANNINNITVSSRKANRFYDITFTFDDGQTQVITDAVRDGNDFTGFRLIQAGDETTNTIIQPQINGEDQGDEIVIGHGQKGDQGTVSLSSFATGAPGTDVIISDDAAGDPTDLQLNITIPRGDTGEPGIDGTSVTGANVPTTGVNQGHLVVEVTDADSNTSEFVSDDVVGASDVTSIALTAGDFIFTYTRADGTTFTRTVVAPGGGQVQQDAITEYGSSITYGIGHVVHVQETAGASFYSSLIASNLGNAVSDDTSWEFLGTATKVTFTQGEKDKLGYLTVTADTDLDAARIKLARYPDQYTDVTDLIDGKLNKPAGNPSGTAVVTVDNTGTVAYSTSFGGGGGGGAISIAIDGTDNTTDVPAGGIAVIDAEQQFYNISDDAIDVGILADQAAADAFFVAPNWVQVGDGGGDAVMVDTSITGSSQTNPVTGGAIFDELATKADQTDLERVSSSVAVEYHPAIEGHFYFDRLRFTTTQLSHDLGTVEVSAPVTGATIHQQWRINSREPAGVSFAGIDARLVLTPSNTANPTITIDLDDEPTSLGDFNESFDTTQDLLQDTYTVNLGFTTLGTGGVTGLTFTDIRVEVDSQATVTANPTTQQYIEDLVSPVVEELPTGDQTGVYEHGSIVSLIGTDTDDGVYRLDDSSSLDALSTQDWVHVGDGGEIPVSDPAIPHTISADVSDYSIGAAVGIANSNYAGFGGRDLEYQSVDGGGINFIGDEVTPRGSVIQFLDATDSSVYAIARVRTTLNAPFGHLHSCDLVHIEGAWVATRDSGTVTEAYWDNTSITARILVNDEHLYTIQDGVIGYPTNITRVENVAALPPLRDVRTEIAESVAATEVADRTSFPASPYIGELSLITTSFTVTAGNATAAVPQGDYGADTFYIWNGTLWEQVLDAQHDIIPPTTDPAIPHTIVNDTAGYTVGDTVILRDQNSFDGGDLSWEAINGGRVNFRATVTLPINTIIRVRPVSDTTQSMFVRVIQEAPHPLGTITIGRNLVETAGFFDTATISLNSGDIRAWQSDEVEVNVVTADEYDYEVQDGLITYPDNQGDITKPNALLPRDQIVDLIENTPAESVVDTFTDGEKYFATLTLAEYNAIAAVNDAAIPDTTDPLFDANYAITEYSITDDTVTGGGGEVTLDTAQTISGLKTFSNGANFSGGTTDFTGTTVTGLVNPGLPANAVTTDGDQTITGDKTYTGAVDLTGATVTGVVTDDSDFDTLSTDQTITGDKTFTGAVDLTGASVTGVVVSDANLVHRTGNETINGVKTFEDTTAFDGAVNIFGNVGIDTGNTLTTDDVINQGDLTVTGTATFNGPVNINDGDSINVDDLTVNNDLTVSGDIIIGATSRLTRGVGGSTLLPRLGTWIPSFQDMTFGSGSGNHYNVREQLAWRRVGDFCEVHMRIGFTNNTELQAGTNRFLRLFIASLPFQPAHGVGGTFFVDFTAEQFGGQIGGGTDANNFLQFWGRQNGINLRTRWSDLPTHELHSVIFYATDDADVTGAGATETI